MNDEYGKEEGNGLIQQNENSVENIPVEPSIAQDVPMQNVPAAGMQAESAPADGTPVQNMPVVNIPAENIVVQNTSAENMPVSGRPANSMQMQGAPVNSMQIQGAPLGSMPVPGVPVNNMPVPNAVSNDESFLISEMPVQKKHKKGNGTVRNVLLAGLVGIIVGVLVCAAAIFIVKMPEIMHRVEASFDIDIEKKDSADIKGKDENEAPAEAPEKTTLDEGAGNISEPGAENAPIAKSSGAAVQIMDASGVTEECMPSIVAITNIYTDSYEGFFGREEYQNEATGSGIIVGQNDTELLIVTNSHVISSAEQLSVQFVDGESYDALVKGSNSEQDLAVIVVELSSLSNDTKAAIKIAKLGDSNTLKVGEPAIAIGNSLGYGQTVTMGIISALDRDFSFENVTRTVIQTDAAINPGNSGGALLNTHGEVIGINEAKYSSTSVEGVGYAIPISSAKPIIEELMNKETRQHPQNAEPGFLGIAGVDVSNEAARAYGMPLGVYVAQVTEGTAAEEYGINSGDIITEFDGIKVTEMTELKKLVAQYAAGETVQIKLYRMGNDGYETMTIDVVLGKRID